MQLHSLAHIPMAMPHGSARQTNQFCTVWSLLFYRTWIGDWPVQRLQGGFVCWCDRMVDAAASRIPEWRSWFVLIRTWTAKMSSLCFLQAYQCLAQHVTGNAQSAALL